MCTEDIQCVMNAFCIGESEDASAKYCTMNYSLQTGAYCFADYHCEGGYCYDGSENIA
jgi:hypothetical protein